MSVPPDACLSAAPVSLRWMLAFQVACVLSVTVACSGLARSIPQGLRYLTKGRYSAPALPHAPASRGTQRIRGPCGGFCGGFCGGRRLGWTGRPHCCILHCTGFTFHPPTHPPTNPLAVTVPVWGPLQVSSPHPSSLSFLGLRSPPTFPSLADDILRAILHLLLLWPSAAEQKYYSIYRIDDLRKIFLPSNLCLSLSLTHTSLVVPSYRRLSSAALRIPSVESVASSRPLCSNRLRSSANHRPPFAPACSSFPLLGRRSLPHRAG